jgi:phenylacetate-CoA ligase
MYWDESVECLPREQMRALQSERLRATVWRCYERVPHYRKALDDHGVHPADVRTVDDLAMLPFATKADLRDNYPYGLFAAPMSEVVRVHASSGTTGKPIVVGYTRSDLDVWAEVMARTLTAGGVQTHDVIQVAYGYGLFTGGLGVHYGAERVGATVVPVSGGNTKRQIMLMKDFGVTVLACTPSFAAYLAEVMPEACVAREDVRLKVGFFGAEPWSDQLRCQIQSALGILAIDIYGLSEIIGPGVAFECPYQCGLHVSEDHFIPEVVHPQTGEVLPPGSTGELVFTTVTRGAAPVLRYRTRDLSRLCVEPCACGRTLARIERILGRTDDMLIIRGVNVFPSQVESVLLEGGHIDPNYLLVVERSAGHMDTLEIWVEVSESLFNDEVRRLESVEKRIRAAMESTLGISVGVKLVEPRTIPRSEGKARRVVDRAELS